MFSGLHLASEASAFVLWATHPSAARCQLLLAAAGQWRGQGECRAKKGHQGQRSRRSVTWWRVDFRSAQSGHKATAAKPQRPTCSCSSQPQICGREPRTGEPSSSPISAFSQWQDGKRFYSATLLRISNMQKICEINSHYFKGRSIVKIMHSRNTVMKPLPNRL